MNDLGAAYSDIYDGLDFLGSRRTWSEILLQ